jgi:FMN-dependent oxidoreductase (nitrilotriacetate monooxygenase family)
MSTKPPVIGIAIPALPRQSSLSPAFDPYDADAIAAFARKLDTQGIDFLLLPDSPLDTRVEEGDGFALETFTLASYVGAFTQRLGIVTTIDTAYAQPFSLARSIASLDHATHGRAGWISHARERGNAAQNHQAAPSTAAARHERSEEAIGVIDGLLKTWDRDAFIRDKESGNFVDTTKVRALDHKGTHFAVKGPLNIAPTPQFPPPRFAWIRDDGTDARTDDNLSAAPESSDVLIVSSTRAARLSKQVVLKRVVPVITDIAGELAHADDNDRFTGTLDAWREAVARWTGADGYDGLLIVLPVSRARDVDYVKALTQGLLDEAAHALTLRARLGLPASAPEPSNAPRHAPLLLGDPVRIDASHGEPAAQRQLHLGLMFWATGTHSAGWRHPLAKTDGAFDIAFIQDICRKVEDAKFDFIFLGDRLVADPALAKTNPGQMARLEPFVVGSAIAAATKHVGIVVTTNTTYSDPFTVARMFASFDLISRGRASWNIVTGADPAAALNFSRTEHWSVDRRYDWADDFTKSVLASWNSWTDGAYSHRDGKHDASVLIDLSGVRPTGFASPLIELSGPSGFPRSPQGRPVILHAGTSERSRDLGARYADVIFTGDARLEPAQAYYRDLKARAKAYGRRPEDLKIVPGLMVVVEPTTQAAIETYDALNELIVLDPEDPVDAPVMGADGGKPNFQYVGMGRGAKRNLSLASEALGVDVRGNPHDALVPPDIYERASMSGRQIIDYITRLTRRNLLSDKRSERITYRDLIYASIAQSSAVVGNPQEVADYMQHWFDNEAADGFNIFPPFVPYAVDRFCELVVPELQRRGIYRRDYSGTTLHGHFDLRGRAS